MLANISVHEPKPPDDPDSPLSFSMEGTPDQPPSALIPFFWSPGWNSIQAVNKFQEEVGGPLRRGDPGVRLIEPATEPGSDSSSNCRRHSSRGKASGCVVPLYHIFGSEELSRSAPGHRGTRRRSRTSRSTGRCLRVSARKSELFGQRLPVKIAARICRAVVAGVPAGVPPLCRARSARCGAGSPECHDQPVSHPLDRRHSGRGAQHRRRADLARAAATGALAGPLRAEPRRSVRSASGRGGHDQDLLQGGLDPAVRRQSRCSSSRRPSSW